MLQIVEPIMQISGSATSPRPDSVALLDLFANCLTGTFQYFLDTDAFDWSDEMYQIHGYEPGQIVPTFELGQSHIHPDMREQSAAFWAGITERGGPASVYLTLRDTTGTSLQVLIVGNQIIDGDTDTVVGAWGLMIDLTHSIHSVSHRFANQAVAASVQKRSVIEQAKGILAGHLGLSLDEAFQLISQHSQDTNRKVNAIAQDIVSQAPHRIPRHDTAFDQARTFLKTLATNPE